jgi:uncharacterized NAD(P)/FAD-binding protein YdhS
MSVHPAMINRFRQQISAADEDDLNALDGWDSFGPDEKKFLAVFGWFGQKNLAAEYIGRSAQWVDRHQRQNPLFKEAVKSRDGMQTRIARNYGADLLGKAMLRLDAMLDEDGADKRTQLNAIQTVLKMNQVDGTVPEQNDGALEVLRELRRMASNNLQAPDITVTGLPGVYEKPQAMK